MLLPTLDGVRVTLRPLSASDSDGLYALWSEPAVCRYAGPVVDAAGIEIPLPARSRAESDRILDYWLDRARQATGFRWAVELSSAGFVGAVGFNALAPRFEYAYHLVPRYWGRGLALEASRLALDWAFAEGAATIEAFIEPENRSSIALAERLGFGPGEPAREGPRRYVLEPRAYEAS